VSDLLEVQKCIIGSILIDSKCVKEVYGLLEPKHFPLTILKRTYSAILALYNRNEPITVVSVSNLIYDDNTTSAVVMDLFRECIDITVTSAQIRFHARILIDEHKKKEYGEIIHKRQAGGVNEVIGSVINQLTDLMQDKRSSSKTLAQIFEENEAKYFNPDYNPNYLYFDYPHLDTLVGGVEDTDLVCIGARPSVGKSILALDLAIKISKLKKVAFYSFEMSEVQLLDRAVATVGKIELSHVRKAKGFEDEIERSDYFSAKKVILENKNLIINASGAKNVGDIRNECRYIENLGVIVIDYLQLMRPMPGAKSGNRTTEVGDISKSLKALSMEIKVPIIILSQLNRAIEGRPDDCKEPRLSDLRESGDIEQDCNIIMFLWNLDKEDTTRKGVSVAKNRQGSTGKMHMLFKGEFMKFYEVDDGKKYFTPQNNVPVKKKSGFLALTDGEQEELPFDDEVKPMLTDMDFN